MKILPFTADNIETIAHYLNEDKPVILPTDTIYGLHLPLNPQNTATINNLKDRDPNQPCNALYADVSQITTLATPMELDRINKILDLPGITTIVSGKSTTGQALRHIGPEFPILHQILLKTGPLLSTSANLAGKTYVHNFEVIKTLFADRVALGCFINNPESNVSPETYLPSTIVDIRNNEIVLVRQGRVSPETLKEMLGL